MLAEISSAGGAGLHSTIQRVVQVLFNKFDQRGNFTIGREGPAALWQQDKSGLDEVHSRAGADQGQLFGLQEFEAGLSQLAREMKEEGFPFNLGMIVGAGAYQSAAATGAIRGREEANTVDDGTGEVHGDERLQPPSLETGEASESSDTGFNSILSRILEVVFNSLDADRDGNIRMDEVFAAMGLTDHVEPVVDETGDHSTA